MEIVFVILSAICLSGAIGVVVAKTPLMSALCLIATMLGIAGFFAQLGSHFLAVTQISVYAGAIMVLVVFVIMLLGAKVELKATSLQLSMIALAGVVAFLAMTFIPALEFFGPMSSNVTVNAFTAKELGESLFGDFAFPFELSSLVILAAIAAAVMLAKKREPYEEHYFKTASEAKEVSEMKKEEA